MQRGANINDKNNYNETPLDFALLRKNIDNCYNLKEDETCGSDTQDYPMTRSEIPINLAPENQGKAMTIFYFLKDKGGISISPIIEDINYDLNKIDEPKIDKNTIIMDGDSENCDDGPRQIQEDDGRPSNYGFIYRNDNSRPTIYKNTLNMVGDSKNFCERPRQFMVEDDGPSPYGFNLVIYEQHLDNILYCLEISPDYINIEDDEGFTPLMMAIYLENSNIVELLLKKGADVNQKNRFGETALHIAASGGYIGIVRLLIQYRADVNSLDVNNFTPMLCAMIHLWNYPEDNKYQFEEVVNILKQNGGISGLEEEKVQSPK